MTDYRIVTGSEAQELPEGSVILLDTAELGAPTVTHPIALTKNPLLDWFEKVGADAKFKVLYVPQTPVEVGHVFPTFANHEQLDSLPPGSVLQDDDFDVAVKTDDGVWGVSQVSDAMTSARVSGYFSYPVRVIHIGSN